MSYEDRLQSLSSGPYKIAHVVLPVGDDSEELRFLKRELQQGWKMISVQIEEVVLKGPDGGLVRKVFYFQKDDSDLRRAVREAFGLWVDSDRERPLTRHEASWADKYRPMVFEPSDAPPEQTQDQE